MDRYDVIIVGAGAAGMMATLIAAQRGLQVLLLEKMEQPGLKLRITGKGRCNITNTAKLSDTLQHIGPEPRFLRNAYSSFFNRDLMQLLENLGLPLVEERGGRVFPASGKAQDVFFTLIKNIEKHKNVDIRKLSPVGKLYILDGDLRGVVLADGTVIRAPQVIVATGGQSYPRTGSTGDGYALLQAAGHSIVPPVPSLTPLVCQEPIPKGLVNFGLRNVGLTITEESGKKLCSFFGEMTFCDDGIAGPIVISASRIVTRRLHEQPDTPLQAHIDLKAALDSDTLDKRLINDLNSNGNRLLDEAMRMWMPEELIPLAL